MDYDASVWGPHFWFFLDNIAMVYPTHPNDVVRKKYYELIQNLPLFIPHYEISKQFSELLNMHPVKPYLDNKKSLIRWTHFIHNVINSKLEKPQITLEQYYTTYYKRYDKSNKTLKRNRKYITFFIILIVIATFCLYLYNK